SSSNASISMNGFLITSICNISFEIVFTALLYLSIELSAKAVFVRSHSENSICGYPLFQRYYKPNISIEQEERYYYTKDKQDFYPLLEEAITSQETIYQWRRKYVRANKSNV